MVLVVFVALPNIYADACPQVDMTVSYSIVNPAYTGYYWLIVAPYFNYVSGGQPFNVQLTTTADTLCLDSGSTWTLSQTSGGSASTLLGGSNSGEATGKEQWSLSPAQSDSGTASEGATVFNYYDQTMQALSYSVVNGGTPTNPTFTANQFGSSAPTTVTTSPLSYWFDAGSSWSVTTITLGPTGEQWVTVFGRGTSGTLSNWETFAFMLDHQYYLTMTAGADGTVKPASGWKNAGQSYSISATPNTGYKFMSWTGTGTGSFTGTIASATIMMNSPITETANFGVKITITSTPTSTSTAKYVTVDSVTVNTPTTFTWTVGSTHTLAALSPVSCGTGCQYVFVSWTSPSIGTVTSASFMYTVPLTEETVTATFHKQYYLTIVVNGPGLVAPSSGWYNAGATVTLTATANGGPFTRWTGTGTGSYTGTSASHTITMNAAITETATFT